MDSTWGRCRKIFANGLLAHTGLLVALGLLVGTGCQPFGAALPSTDMTTPFGMVPPTQETPPAPTFELTSSLESTPALAPTPDLAPAMSQGIHVPVANHDLAWEKIVDIVDDYFRIERERSVQMVGQVMTEGRIDTFPQVGASVLEPHLADSVGWRNRFESTFQTIRRKAVVRVIPDESGYLIDVTVQKELEDLPQPEHATAQSATFHGNVAGSKRLREDVSRTEFARYWIPLGRDTVLEKEILEALGACLGTR